MEKAHELEEVGCQEYSEDQQNQEDKGQQAEVDDQDEERGWKVRPR